MSIGDDDQYQDTQKLPQPGEKAGEVLADGGEDGTAARACEVVVVHGPVASRRLDVAHE